MGVCRLGQQPRKVAFNELCPGIDASQLYNSALVVRVVVRLESGAGFAANTYCKRGVIDEEATFLNNKVGTCCLTISNLLLMHRRHGGSTRIDLKVEILKPPDPSFQLLLWHQPRVEFMSPMAIMTEHAVYFRSWTPALLPIGRLMKIRALNILIDICRNRNSRSSYSLILALPTQLPN